MTETHFSRSLKMQALPGSEYHLYTLLREHLNLKNMREVFILGCRAIYAMWHDPALQPILLNLLRQLAEDRTDIESNGKLEYRYTPLEKWSGLSPGEPTVE